MHSFTSSTSVELADGSSKPISQVKVGDTVQASDPQTGVTAPEKVQHVIVTTTDEDFTDVTVANPDNKAATLTTTWHHPFWDATHQRWTDARNLTPGTRLHNPKGTTSTVLHIRNYHRHTTTYDLTVNRIHTYYVLAGVTPILVHNCGPSIDDLYDNATEVVPGKGSEAARAYQKHMTRPNSQLPILGTGKARSSASKEIIGDLLTNPKSVVRRYSHDDYGDVVDYLLPNSGARWNAETGKLIGFLESPVNRLGRP